MKEYEYYPLTEEIEEMGDQIIRTFHFSPESEAQIDKMLAEMEAEDEQQS